MSRRRSRLGDEDSGHRAPASGPNVFPESKDDARPYVLIPVSGVLIKCRWPAATARRQTGQAEVIRTEIIDMKSKPKIGVLADDPYLMAEERAAKRKGAA